MVKDVGIRYMLNPETRGRLLLARVTCTVVLFVTACMLVVAWFGNPTTYDSVSVAIVFGGALIARCQLVAPSGKDAQQATASGERRRDGARA